MSFFFTIVNGKCTAPAPIKKGLNHPISNTRKRCSSLRNGLHPYGFPAHIIDHDHRLIAQFIHRNSGLVVLYWLLNPAAGIFTASDTQQP